MSEKHKQLAVEVFKRKLSLMIGYPKPEKSDKGKKIKIGRQTFVVGGVKEDGMPF